MQLDKTLRSNDEDDLVDAVIAAVGGDPREAVRALIRGQDAIRAEALRNVSPGYTRGRAH